MAHPEKRKPSGKWIASVAPSDRIGDAARECLRVRFSVIQDLLPAAAMELDDAGENVHQLRVAIRRAVAAMDLFGTLLPRKKARRMRRRLKKIRRAAGDARDLDVLQSRLTEVVNMPESPLARELSQRRKEAQSAIIAIHKKTKRQGILTRKTDKLLNQVWLRNNSEEDETTTFGNWSRLRLREITNEFFDQWPPAGSYFIVLHQFRIRTKALRYSAELLAPAFATEFRKATYPQVEELQETLGTISDHATAAERFRQWQKSSEECEQQTMFAKLAKRETKLLSETTAAFHRLWTSQRIADFQKTFSEVKTSAQ